MMHVLTNRSTVTKTSKILYLLGGLKHLLSDSQLLLRGAELLPQVFILLCQPVRHGSSRGVAGERHRAGQCIQNTADVSKQGTA